MVLRDSAYAACFGGGGNPDWSCDPSNPYCYEECYDQTCCYDYNLVAATTIASTGLKQCSAVSQTMDIW